jgi:hypothetical protein
MISSEGKNVKPSGSRSLLSSQQHGLGAGAWIVYESGKIDVKRDVSEAMAGLLWSISQYSTIVSCD